MKIFFAVLFTLSSYFSFAQVHWITINEALEAQKKVPKKIFIAFTDDHCEPCQKMEKIAFDNPVIAKLISDKFYAVKFFADSKEKVSFRGRDFDWSDKATMHSFAKYMNISTVPTLVFLDEQAAPITSLMGALSAKDVEPYFSMISTQDYKSIKSRQQCDDYQRKFKSKIKD